MADDCHLFTQELSSAKYLVDADVEEPMEPVFAEPAAPPRRSGLEQTIRWLTPLVVVMLVTAAGGLYWQNRASIASTAGELKQRRCAFDLLLWASGSKKTFNQGISDSLRRAQRDSAFQFDDSKPAFKSEFDGVDFSNLSEAWNGKH